VTHQPVSEVCACPCGASRFTVVGYPIARLLCHCTICQSLYRQTHADVTVFWAGAVTLQADHRISFKRYRLPPALRRGTCPTCGAPVFGYLRLAPFVQLAFVPSRNFSRPSVLPAASAHIFYHRRVEDVVDGLPKVSGYWRSEWAVAKLVVKGLFHSKGR
jgi:hypothetical protein